MREIIIYPGSFNPMHIGHLCLANYVVETHPHVDELWVSITPANPFKEQRSLLPEELRVRWATHLTAAHPKLHVSTVELTLPRPNYTYHTLTHLREQHPDCHFTLFMGMDSLHHLPRWYESKRLLAETPVMVYPRPGYDLPRDPILLSQVQLLEAPVFDISATLLRRLLRQGAHLPYFLHTPTDHPLYQELLSAITALPEG